jgi:hypothetical protein
VAALVAGMLPTAAFAGGSDSSISIAAPVASNGPVIYAGYPFSFSGHGTDDASAEIYDVTVLYTPASSTILQPLCPSDLGAASQSIDEAFGGPDAVASYEALGVTNPALGAGPFTYKAYVNSDVVPTVTSPGRWVACSFLTEEGGPTVASSPAPVHFTVKAPPGSGNPPSGFGGSPGSPRPPNLTLTVAPDHAPVRAPGFNLIDVSGHFDPSEGEAFLTVTLNNAKLFNRCAADDEQEVQITQADGGAVLTQSEQVVANSAGAFRSPVGLHFIKKVSGTGLICAYLNQAFSDIAVGYYRFTLPTPKAAAHQTVKG